MINFYTLGEIDKWDTLVKSFKKYDVYYLSGYVKAFHVNGDGKPMLIYYESESLKAINVVIKRDIALDKNLEGKISENKYYDFITPYGYGGFLMEGNQDEQHLKELNDEYNQFCIENNVVSEFVRFHPVIKTYENMDVLYDVTMMGKTVTMDLTNKETIWQNIASKNRNMIRKAKKSGVKIYWGRSPELFDEFRIMYEATMDRDNADNYYYFKDEFYTSILEDLKNNSMIFYAMIENTIIAMSIILYSNHSMHYHLSASNQKYLKYAPTNLLLYEVACWGSENGFITLHLGGGLGSSEDSLYKFKSVFNKQSNTQFAIGKKVFEKQIYKELCFLRDNLIDSHFFPKYRS